jgi:CRISPR-associated endonuclease Csn1
MSKKILGLDLGTTSIGWAFINEAENENEQSSIESIGVRVNPLSTEELSNFEKGKAISINTNRTIKRSARRNLQRYKKRREILRNVLIDHGIINEKTILAEDEKNSTHETYALRSAAAKEAVTLDAFARILFMLNKKRGYKSTRKGKNEDEGEAIDGMSIAKRLYDENITPGQLCFQLLKDNIKYLPDFYRSDLENELQKVWNFQKQFNPEILTDEFKKEILGKGSRATSAIFWTKYKFNISENKGSKEDKKLKAYEWRSISVEKQLSKEEVAYVITEINNNISNSSGYLGAISDRSKELFFNNETIGEYLYRKLKSDFHTNLKNQVFYRQDYLDEFDKIWETQAKYHEQLTPSLKGEIRDIIIFYQRKLKSQKGLVSICEFENRILEIIKDGKKVNKSVGLKVIPKSSPLFQEFKIWQVLQNLEFRNKKNKQKYIPDIDAKFKLFEELNIKGNLESKKIIEILGYTPIDWEINYKEVPGNQTNQVLYESYLKILELEGYNTKELLKIKSDKDDILLSEVVIPASEIKQIVKSIFESLNINTEILTFNANIEGKLFEQQMSYQLWHLIYSYEDDKSNTGNENLFELLSSKFGFTREQSKLLVNIRLSNDYGNLSAKAIRNIYPFIKENNYSEACHLA